MGYVQFNEGEADIGLSLNGNIYWHDGHIDMPNQHWEWVERADQRGEKLARRYSAAPVKARMSNKQVERAERALFIRREAQHGRFYDLEGGELVRIK